MMALCILLVFALIIGGFALFLWWRRKAQGDRFARSLDEQGAGAPQDISAAAQRAKLDDLRKRFQGGLREYELRGKSIYSLPWYLIVGEPGSGKTEAIRHSEVGFPPGLNEFMQGAGGTINMNWWFTNRAVILDTAGRLMFEKVKPGETSEWREFLNLLKKARPNCPINGLFLTIPVDTLIKDTADKIGAKARQIAKQLDVIQRALDVRFPVYILVTKCDLAIGFRESFDGITDPALQHQLIGWSNPEDLDAPFRPDLVAEHLNTVAKRLQRRRLSLLRDPAAQTEGGRRLPEVDQMYALPTSISQTIAVRLERYLNILFEQGEWSAKPVFLRGIYFTSSMREGSALDADLAEALGIDVSELPPTRAFEKERAFFLRDMFIEKAFREAGLVTRASNAGRMLKRRQIALVGVAAVAMAVLGVFAWFGMGDLNRTIRKEMVLWQAATGADSWGQGMWMPIVVPQAGAARTYRYRGDETIPKLNVNYVQFHTALQERAFKPLEVGWIFRPISLLVPSGDMNRKEPQRVVFERGVVYPLVAAARSKMTMDESTPAAYSPARQMQLLGALTSLIRLEVDGVKEPRSLGGVAPARQYLESWLSYATGTNQVANTNLVVVMDATYSAKGSGEKKWPPAWLLGGDSLAKNPPIARGLQQYFAGAQIGQRAVLDRMKLIEQARTDANAYQMAERKIYSDILAFQQRPGAREVSFADLDAVKPTKLALDQSLDAAQQAKLFQGDAFQLVPAYKSLLAEGHASSKEALMPIYNSLPKDSKKPLFGEVRSLLDSQQSGGIVDQIQRSADADKNMPELDASVLSVTNALFAYRQRWGLYQAALAILPRQRLEFNDMLGREWAFADWRDKKKQLDKLTGDYQGPWRREAMTICEYFLAKGEKAIQEEWIAYYVAEAAKAILSIPLPDMNLLLSKLEKDLAQSALSRIPTEQLPKLNQLRDKIPVLYAQRIQERLAQIAIFPMVAAAPERLLSLEDLRRERSFLQDCVKAADMPLLRESPEVRTVKEKVLRYDSVVRAILSEDGLPLNCTVGLAADQERTTAFTYRGIMMESGQKPFGMMETTMEKLQELGKVSLDKDITIHVHKFKQEPSVSDRSFAAWGPLALIVKNKDGARRANDGRTWFVKYPVPEVGSKETLNLQLEFERALPELEKWAAP
jgi:hypothetical protein